MPRRKKTIYKGYLIEEQNKRKKKITFTFQATLFA